MVAEALSQCDEEVKAVCAIFVLQMVWFDNIRDEIKATPSLLELRQHITIGMVEPL